MGSCVMDAMDDRAFITLNIPGAFLQGDWPHDEHPAYIKFEGLMVDMICESPMEQTTDKKILICSIGEGCVRNYPCSNYIL